LHDIDIIDVSLVNAKANATQVVLRFSFKRKRGEEVPCGGALQR